jgi:hypothetical protein
MRRATRVDDDPHTTADRGKPGPRSSKQNQEAKRDWKAGGTNAMPALPLRAAPESPLAGRAPVMD